jgi:hypothetical protein
MKVRNACLIGAIVLSLPAVGGCAANPNQEHRPKLVPVHGVVRFNGQPLEGARVTFTNPEAKLSAYGLTDADGKFTLTTFTDGDGAAPGPQKIAVTKVQETGHPTAKTAPPAFRRGGAPRPRWLIPFEYSNPETSGLTAQVAESGNDEIVVELKGSAK